MPIRAATSADLPRVAETLATAFKDRPILGQYLHPYRGEHPDGMYLHFLRRLRLVYARGPPDDYVLVSYEPRAGTGDQKITEVATWHRRRANPRPRSWYAKLKVGKTQIFDYLGSLVWPNGAIEPSRAQLFEQLEPFIAHHWAGTRAEVLDLDLIAVDSASGKKSYGRQLVAWGFEKARQDDVGCSVIVARGVAPIYHACGYDVEAGNMKDAGGVHYDANVLSMRITRQAASWLALTPQKVVQKTLDLPQELIDTLPKTKRYIFPGNTNLTTTNFTVAESQNAKLTATSET
ncbi:hypothetical protein LTR74_017946 [Friedmanniomyces endolithicus]|nr:hypothetical protein LTR74_017946 [Friedmanniomyces endolithicus]